MNLAHTIRVEVGRRVLVVQAAEPLSINEVYRRFSRGGSRPAVYLRPDGLAIVSFPGVAQ